MILGVAILVDILEDREGGGKSGEVGGKQEKREGDKGIRGGEVSL